MKHGLTIIGIAAALFASYPAFAQSHGSNANSGVGPSMNGGSGSNGANEGPSYIDNTPANSGSRANNSTVSNTNGRDSSNVNNPYNGRSSAGGSYNNW